MLNITNFVSYPFSQKPFIVPEGKAGSVFYNFTETTRLQAQGTLDVFAQSLLSPEETFLIYYDISPRGDKVVTESFTVLGNFTENLYTLCDARNLSPSESYTLNFTIEALRGQPASFDRLLLETTPATKVDGLTTIMNHRHLMIQYNRGQWENLNNAVHYTNKTQAKMRLDFNGTSIRWYTIWLKLWGTSASDASWQIDDQPYQSFTIPAIDPQLRDPFFEELLFKTPDLSPGQHRLEVTYNGFESTRPLALAELVIEDMPPSSSASPSPSTTPSGLPPSNIAEAGGLSQGTKIAIGVSTSVAGLFVCSALLFFLYQRRRKTAQRNESRTTREEAPDSSISPYLSSATPHATTTSKGTPVMTSMSPYPTEPNSSIYADSKGTPVPSSPRHTNEASMSMRQEDNPPPYLFSSGSSDTRPTFSPNSPRIKG
ncbi:hypothetical protein BJ165DRAFT_1524699 [Panaeolus papilionaceus]|nr:hypothetical protein BJ165DRAFT_1524699 [Panaeolus papilionaceus]